MQVLALPIQVSVEVPNLKATLRQGTDLTIVDSELAVSVDVPNLKAILGGLEDFVVLDNIADIVT